MRKSRKRSDIRLVTNAEEASKLADKPHCMDVRIFDEGLVGIQLRKVKLIVNKPSFVGFAVLELSKLCMWKYESLSLSPLFYPFHSNFLSLISHRILFMTFIFRI